MGTKFLQVARDQIDLVPEAWIISDTVTRLPALDFTGYPVTRRLNDPGLK